MFLNAARFKASGASFKFTYFHTQVERLIQSSQEAHQNCQQFVLRLAGYSEAKYLNVLNKSRVKALQEFVSCLTGMNRGYLVNNLDAQFMSMPLEYSIENNMWLVQGMQTMINRQVKEIKFQ